MLPLWEQLKQVFAELITMKHAACTYLYYADTVRDTQVIADETLEGKDFVM